MSFNTRYLFALTTLLALAANACSGSTPRIARASAAPVQCAGGVIQSADDAARYAGCTAVAGNLAIANSNLEDLTALESLRNVSGTLVVSNNANLSDFTGLEQLTAVGSLEVIGNPALSNFTGLSALRRAKAVKIQKNPELFNLRGLEGLEQVEKLEIVGNGLSETAGLTHLAQVGELTIANNPKLISLRGLNGLTRAGSVRIRNNQVLCAQLGLLPQLGEVSEALVLSSNRSVSKREVEGLLERVKVSFPPATDRQAALR